MAKKKSIDGEGRVDNINVQVTLDDYTNEELNEIANTIKGQEIGTTTDIQRLNCKLAKTLPAISDKMIDENKQKMDLKLGVNDNLELHTVITLDWSQNQSLMEAQYTQLDRMVYDIIISFCAKGMRAFTPSMIYRSMAGHNGDITVSDVSKAAIKKSINKLTSYKVDLDYTAQVNKRHSDITKFIIKDRLLNVVEANVTINGQDTTGYMLLNTPSLYNYAKNLNQLVSYSSKDLLPPGNATLQRSLIANYLRQHIAILQHNPKYNRKITYTKLYKEFEAISPRDKITVREYIATCLDYWVDKGIITSWECEKHKNAYYAVVINV